MPTKENLSFNFSNLSLIDKIASRFVSEVQSLFSFRKSIKLVPVWGHKIKSIKLTEPTVCSQCDKLIIGIIGARCVACKLVCHEACVHALKEPQLECIRKSANPNEQQSGQSLQGVGQQQVSNEHNFKPKFFLKPSFCDHCGTLMKGLIQPQGMLCEECDMQVHFECLPWIPIRCKDFVNRKDYARVADGMRVPEMHDCGSTRITDFDLKQIISCGSFSKVYLACLKSEPNKMLAIKAIKKTNLYTNSDPESVITEMKVLHLNRSYKFLALAHCCFQTKDRLFIIMEHVAGRDLYYHVTKYRKLTEERTRFYSAELVLALRFLHKHRIIHRDLKLDNVILDNEGHCKLIDYGLAKMLKADQTTRTICGTPCYMSPEIIKEQSYSFAVDWWALGVMMYEMLTGSSPMNSPNDDPDYDELCRRIVHEDIKYPALLSPASKSILKGFLSKDPNRRLGSDVMDDCELAIMRHEFFRFRSSADGSWAHRWADIEYKQLKPPYVPTNEELIPLSCDGGESPARDDEGGIILTPVSSQQLSQIPPVTYEGFSYCSQSFKCLLDRN